jgi:hypothetical protein
MRRRRPWMLIALLTYCATGSLTGTRAQERPTIPLTVRPAARVGQIEELAGYRVKVPYARVVAVYNPRVFLVETASRITRPAVDHSELLWVLWLIVKADAVVHENERLLLKHVAALVGDLNSELSAERTTPGFARREHPIRPSRRRFGSGSRAIG